MNQNDTTTENIIQPKEIDERIEEMTSAMRAIITVQSQPESSKNSTCYQQRLIILENLKKLREINSNWSNSTEIKINFKDENISKCVLFILKCFEPYDTYQKLIDSEMNELRDCKLFLEELEKKFNAPRTFSKLNIPSKIIERLDLLQIKRIKSDPLITDDDTLNIISSPQNQISNLQTENLKDDSASLPLPSTAVNVNHDSASVPLPSTAVNVNHDSASVPLPSTVVNLNDDSPSLPLASTVPVASTTVNLNDDFSSLPISDRPTKRKKRVSSEDLNKLTSEDLNDQNSYDLNEKRKKPNPILHS